MTVSYSWFLISWPRHDLPKQNSEPRDDLKTHPSYNFRKNRLLSSKKSQEMIVMGCVATLKIRMHLWTFDIMWPVESSYSTNVIKSHIFQKHKLEINAQKNVYRSQFLAQWTPLWTLNNPTTIKKNTHHYMYLKLYLALRMNAFLTNLFLNLK